MNGKSIIAGLLTVLLVLTGVYYFTNKGKNFSLFPKRTSTTVSKQTGTSPAGFADQGSSQNLKGNKQVTVEMASNAFQPSIITIDAGTTVTWKNTDTTAHTISTDPNPTLPAQNSGEIRSGELYSIKFDAPGQYSYRCSIHADSGMTGQVIVE